MPTPVNEPDLEISRWIARGIGVGPADAEAIARRVADEGGDVVQATLDAARREVGFGQGDWDALLRIARSHSLDLNDAEDAVQNTLLSLLNRNRLEGASPRYVRWRSLDQTRERKRRVWRSEADMDAMPAEATTDDGPRYVAGVSEAIEQAVCDGELTRGQASVLRAVLDEVRAAVEDGLDWTDEKAMRRVILERAADKCGRTPLTVKKYAQACRATGRRREMRRLMR